MNIFPAIDLVGGKAVRLYKGDYAQMTVYDDDPLNTARRFEAAGARYIHMVDLEGARDGGTSNFDVVAAICRETGLKVEIGGGIRTMETIDRYMEAGVRWVILGTKAVTDENFLLEALAKYGDRIEVGVDAKDGKVAVKGWTEVMDVDMIDFIKHLEEIGVKNVICTDISRDGAMRGTNLDLYRRLSAVSGMNITASGGVSNYEDIRTLRDMEVYGAIVGKAMYTGDIDLKKAIALAEGEEAE